MSERILDNTEFIVERFACDCTSAGHSLDFTLELTDSGKRVVQCEINLYMAGKASWKWRIKQAIECLRGKDGQLADFVLRPQDAPRFIALLGRL